MTEDFSIVVAVENSGDFQETEVQVTIRILQEDEIRKSKRIPSINAGETEEVTFENFTNINFTALTTLKVTVAPVAGRGEHGQQHGRLPGDLQHSLTSLGAPRLLRRPRAGWIAVGAAIVAVVAVGVAVRAPGRRFARCGGPRPS